MHGLTNPKFKKVTWLKHGDHVQPSNTFVTYVLNKQLSQYVENKAL